MKRYRVERKERGHFVLGLRSCIDGSNNTLLAYQQTLGPIETVMRTDHMMHRALCDAYIINNLLKTGDGFLTEFGNFVCHHDNVVSPLFQMSPKQKREKAPWPFDVIVHDDD